MDDKLFNDIQQFLKNPDEKEAFLSEDDINTIILSLAKARGESGFTEEECYKLIQWCELQIVGESLVQMLLNGLVLIDDPTGEFKEPLVRLTSYGQEMKEKLI